jgi:hypothetical protein
VTIDPDDSPLLDPSCTDGICEIPQEQPHYADPHDTGSSPADPDVSEPGPELHPWPDGGVGESTPDGL